MIRTTNTTEQTLQPGASLVMQLESKSRRGCECFMNNSESVKLMASGTYEVSWGGNIGGETAATQVQVSIALGGSAVNGGTMTSTPAAVADRNSVSRRLLISNCCGDYDRVSIKNTGTVPVIIAAGSTLDINRLS